MVGALLYLRLTSARNLVRSRLRRLKQPKYLFGAIVGGAYLWFFFLRRAIIPEVHGPNGAPTVSPELQSLPLLFIALPVMIVVAKRLIEAWVAPDDKPGLSFTEAEVAFLFPAPLSRRMLVHFKLLGSQISILFTSLLMALFASRAAALGGNYLIHSLGLWMIFSTLNLHATGAAFTVTRLIDGGVSRWRRQAMVIGAVVLLLGAAALVAWRTAPPPTAAQSANALTLLRYAAGLTENGALYWMALPFKIALAPFFSANWPEFLRALGPALLLLLAHYAWVVRAETSFEEASIALAEKRTAQLAALQEGKYRLGSAKPKAQRGPFRLASAGGRPEVAFLWKNLLATSSFFRPRTFFYAAMLVIIGCSWLQFVPSQRSKLVIVFAVALILALYTLLFGSQLARQDLRSDLPHTDILKSYPLAGWQVLLGEILAPTAILSCLLWLSLFALTLSLRSRHLEWLTPELRVVGSIGIALIIPVLCALQMLVPNAAAVLLPGWTQTTRRYGERGIEMLGQRLIFIVGQFLVIALALLPAAAGAALLVFSTQWLIGLPAAVALAAVAVLVILIGEVAAGLWWLGERFERFDLSAELRP